MECQQNVYMHMYVHVYTYIQYLVNILPFKSSFVKKEVDLLLGPAVKQTPYTLLYMYIIYKYKNHQRRRWRNHEFSSFACGLFMGVFGTTVRYMKRLISL